MAKLKRGGPSCNHWALPIALLLLLLLLLVAEEHIANVVGGRGRVGTRYHYALILDVFDSSHALLQRGRGVLFHPMLLLLLLWLRLLGRDTVNLDVRRANGMAAVTTDGRSAVRMAS